MIALISTYTARSAGVLNHIVFDRTLATQQRKVVNFLRHSISGTLTYATTPIIEPSGSASSTIVLYGVLHEKVTDQNIRTHSGIDLEVEVIPDFGFETQTIFVWTGKFADAIEGGVELLDKLYGVNIQR